MTDAVAATRAAGGDRMTVAVGIIRDFEGLRTTAYRCPAGVCTIGYGHTGDDVHYGLVITRARAEQLLDRDLRGAAAAVERMVKAPLGEKAFGALISWVYNIGEGAASESTLIFLISRGRYAEAAEQFGRWNKEKVNGHYEKSAGLSRRRAAERAMFLEGVK